MKKYILIFILLFSLSKQLFAVSNHSGSSTNNSSDCRMAFIHTVFASFDSIKTYRGQEGYLSFVEEHFLKLNMSSVFIYVSQALPKKKFKKLGWQLYRGTVIDFLRERSRILYDGKIREEYIGPEGYAKYAELYYDSQMQRAFINVSAVLSKMQMKELGWQVYRGTVISFREERSRIFNEQGRLREEYIGPEGYAKYAELHHDSQMQRAFTNVSAVLSKAEMKKLNWKLFQGITKQFYQLRDYFKAHRFADYQDYEGQKKVAWLIFKGNLRVTYMNVSTLREYLFSNKDEFENLRRTGWVMRQ